MIFYKATAASVRLGKSASCVSPFLAIILASCSAHGESCEPPPDPQQKDLSACLYRAVQKFDDQSRSDLDLVKAVVGKCKVELDRVLDHAQSKIEFPASRRSQYHDLIQKAAEQEALRYATQARTSACQTS